MEAVSSVEARGSSRAGGRWLVIATWCVLTGLAIALDGVTGAVVAVVVGAVVLARLPRQILGGLGVLALLGVPIAVVRHGVPNPSDVSPLFVVGSLWPHHLMFAGLALVGCEVALDLADHMRATAARGARVGERPHGDGVDPPDPVGRLPLIGRYVLMGVVAVAGLAAAVAVWSQ